MIVTIHQPNFMPWYPFFQKIQQADVFILLGHCQFEKGGYQNRFTFNNRWNTMSVEKGLDFIKIKRYIDAKRDWERIKQQLPEYKHILSEMDCIISNDLYETNKSIINYLMDKLNIKTKMVEDYPTDFTSTARLVDLCKHYGATTYLAGQGSREYLDESLFTEAGIQVEYQNNLNTIHTLKQLNEVTRI
jgi:hypothetical protein